MNKHKNSVSLVCRACGKKAKDGEHLRSVTVPNYRTAKLLSLLNQDENKPDHEKVCRGCLRKMQSFGSKSRSEDQQKWFDDFGFYRFPAICSGLVCEICNQFPDEPALFPGPAVVPESAVLPEAAGSPVSPASPVCPSSPHSPQASGSRYREEASQLTEWGSGEEEILELTGAQMRTPDPTPRTSNATPVFELLSLQSTPTSRKMGLWGTRTNYFALSRIFGHSQALSQTLSNTIIHYQTTASTALPPSETQYC